MVRIGIDLGGTNIVAGVMDSDYKLLAKARCKTNASRPARRLSQIWHAWRVKRWKRPVWR